MLRISILILVTWLSLNKTILYILVFTKFKPKRSWSDPRFLCHFFSVDELILLSDAIWWHRSGSVLVQVITCCLVAPSHCLTQYWPIIRSTVIHLRAFLQDLPRTSIPKFSFNFFYHFRPLKYHLSTTKYYFTPLFHIRRDSSLPSNVVGKMPDYLSCKRSYNFNWHTQSMSNVWAILNTIALPRLNKFMT